MINTKLPLGENISDEKIRLDYNMVQDVPFDNESISYRVLVPKNWNPMSIHLKSRPVINAEKMTGIGMFVGPQMQNTKPFILLQVMELHQEMAAADVLRGYVLANDYKLKTIQENSPKRVDSLVEFEIEGAKFFGRAMMGITGNRVGFLLAAGPYSDYDDLEDTFALAAASFNMTKAPQGDIESWRECKIGTDWLSFSYPISWNFSRPSSFEPNSRAGVELYHTDIDENIIGIIRIKVVLKANIINIETELKKFMDELEEMGVEFGEIMARDTLSVNGRFIEGHQVVYQALDKKTGLVREVWCTLLEDDEYLSFFALLTTRREDAFSIWAVNKRAWQIIMNTLE